MYMIVYTCSVFSVSVEDSRKMNVGDLKEDMRQYDS